MMLDGHIHMYPDQSTSPAEKARLLLEKMKKAGVSGGQVISSAPHWPTKEEKNLSPAERVAMVTELCAQDPWLFPCYWVNAIDEDACEQVDMAVAAGVDSFKVICSEHAPSDPRAMKTYHRIAGHHKPILFHSGIVWDGKPSAPFNRPGEFECLLEVPGLTFTLAHVSWPWCDECIAVFGKFLNAYSVRPDLSTEMFVDLTPGTPVRWRREVLDKLFMGDYDVMHNVIFGTDCAAESYNVDWTKQWIERDNGLYAELGASAREGFAEHIYKENLLRYLGKSKETVEKKIPLVAV